MFILIPELCCLRHPPYVAPSLSVSKLAGCSAPVYPRGLPGPLLGASRSRLPLQRVGGDPAGGGADPQAEGDADAVAGEAAVQVVPVPERGRGAGRLPHGWLGSTPPSARAFAWPGTRAQPPRPPAVLGAATPRPLLWFGSAVAAPGRAHRPRASDGRVQFPSREPAAAETKGKSFRARAAPYPWRYCRGSAGGRPPPSGGIWEQPRHKGCGPAPRTEALRVP